MGVVASKAAERAGDLAWVQVAWSRCCTETAAAAWDCRCLQSAAWIKQVGSRSKHLPEYKFAGSDKCRCCPNFSTSTVTHDIWDDFDTIFTLI